MRDSSEFVRRTVTSRGRRLVGGSYGPSSGAPVLFVAGAATGKAMCFGEDILREQQVRIHTMDRPGMGQSEFDSRRTLSSTAADYRAFMSGESAEELTPVPVVANSQGAMFGIALALSGWASSLTLVSPADEVAHPVIHDMLPPEATYLADLVRDDPAQAKERLGSFTAAAMEQMVLAGSSPEDRDFYLRPEFLKKYRAALHEGFAGNGAAYVQDTLMAMRPWDLEMSEVACPVNILIGSNDQHHSPDLGETLASRFPAASRTVIPDAGGALLWTHAALVLEHALVDDRRSQNRCRVC